ncbi:MAG: hypothetical protein J6Y54_09040 [Lentisphaeria bacterium]|nr:hypothetical protein [Lentisphaeria bacterium]
MATRTADELRRLASPEFDALLAGDPELQRLKSLKFDKPLDIRVLFDVLGLGDWRIGKLPVLPLTAAKWAFLWALDNPLVSDGEMTEVDLDIALYVLSCPDLRKIRCGLSGIPSEADGYVRATGMNLKGVADELKSVCRAAFRPLEMLSESGESTDDEPARYDGVWLASIAGVAAREANTSVFFCMHRMSLAAVCAYFVSWRRRESSSGEKFQYRPDPAVTAAIYARLDVLEEEFLKRGTAPHSGEPE